MRVLGQVASAVALMAFGAQLLAQYLISSKIVVEENLRHVQPTLSVAFWTFALIASSFTESKPSHDLRNPAPRQSGVAVVLVTGMVASVVLARSNNLLGLLIATVTLIVAAVVWQFASAHAGDIGEARFPNSASRG